MRGNTSRYRWPTAVDLFAGSGAATAALRRSNFRVLAAVDFDPDACETYRLNHPNVEVFEQDIATIDETDFKKQIIPDARLDLLVICAPCQPFSNQNKNREGDKRSRLLIEAARFVRALRPKVIFVENVPGIASEKNFGLLEEFMVACGAKYNFSDPHLVDAADYGVPQRRRRCLLMATDNGEPPKLPAATTPSGMRVTVKDAIGHLPALASGQTDPQDIRHVARNHSEIALKRLRAIPRDGGSRSSLPSELELDCHKGSNAFPDVYGRMKWNDIAPTLTTGCTDVTKGRFAHPTEDRAISPREAALLQTFPANYKFSGSSKVVATQVGNAIPFQLVRSFVPALRQAIFAEA